MSSRRNLSKEDRQHNEEGVAMVTAILATTIVLILSLIAVSLSTHSSTASGLDRSRTLGLHAAEAGLDRLTKLIQSSPPQSLPCATPTTGSVSDGAASYSATVVYHYAYPPVPGTTEIACSSLSSASKPVGAAISSVGRSRSGARRTLQSQVRISPIIGGFNSAIFSDSPGGTLRLENNFTVTGADADIYTNGNIVCENGVTLSGSVFAQGTALFNNTCTVGKNLWAKGNVTLQGSSKVLNDTFSSEGSITISSNQNPTVQRNARSGTSCTGCTTQKIGGTVTANSPLPPPPVQALPPVYFKPTAWQNAGYTILRTFGPGECNAANNYVFRATPTPNVQVAVTKEVVRITDPTCVLTNPNNVTVTLPHDIAIISDGEIKFSQSSTIRSSSSEIRTLFLQTPTMYRTGVPEAPDTLQPCLGTQGDISTAQLTEFQRVQVSIYTPCTVTVVNNSAGSIGQIYGGQVNISNQGTLAYPGPILIPGAGEVTGYRVDKAFTREVISAP